MFGKPEWFGKSDIGIGYLPIAWQGWAFYLGWSAVIAAPLVLLISAAKVPEAGVWALASSGTFIWNSVRLKRETFRRRELESLFYIGDEVDSTVTTENYELNLKQRNV